MSYLGHFERNAIRAAMSAGGALVLIGTVSGCTPASSAGPYGGDVVPLEEGEVNAEILANSESGEILTHTWNGDLSGPAPIEAEPLEIGSGEDRVVLEPHPTESDAAGYCSRFYGRAEWVSEGAFEDGWIRRMHDRAPRHEFAWRHSWAGGRSHASMWSEMGRHGDHGGPQPGHGPGAEVPRD